MTPISIEKNGFIFSSNPGDINLDQVHEWLTRRSYWAQGISKERVAQSIQHSYCLSVLENGPHGRQVGFGRLITDYTVFAYLADIFVLEEYQGKGLGFQLVKTLIELPWMKEIRKIMLATLDAQSFYAKLGFQPLLVPDRYMEINRSNLKKPSLT